jgi:hypothetical protein
MKNKAAILAECKRRHNFVSAGNYESGYLRIQRLLGWLQRSNPLMDKAGNIKETITVREYFLRYDREEYLKIINAIKNNRRTYGVIHKGLNMTYSIIDERTFKRAMQ